MKLPFLKLVGGLALFWVAVKLVAPESHDPEDTPKPTEDLWRAVRVVVVANIVMSLDNVIAVAAAAKGNYLLLGLGLAVSIPVVIAGSALFLAILERFPSSSGPAARCSDGSPAGSIPDDPMVQKILAGTTMVAMEDRIQPVRLCGAPQVGLRFRADFRAAVRGHRRDPRWSQWGSICSVGARTRELEAVVDILTHSAEELSHGARLHGTQPVGAKD